MRNTRSLFWSVTFLSGRVRAREAMLPADYVFGLAVVLVVAFNLYFGPRIARERIAMQ
jgi:hypothetical protein